MVSTATYTHTYVSVVYLSGLWGAINWFVLNVGLADPREQEAELFGVAESSSAAQGSGGETRKETEGLRVSSKLTSEDKKAK